MVEVAAQRQSRSTWGTLVLILLVAAGLRFWGLGFGLPFGQARPDETYVMDVVRPLLLGQAPPPSYEYPWLYMALTSIGWMAYYVVGAVQGTFDTFAAMPESWRAHAEPFFLINRGITAAMGTATVLIVFAIGRRLWDTATALAAAAFMAVAYLHVRDSHYGTTDVPTTCLAMLSLLLLLRAHERAGLAGYAWAGVAAGLAGATKYTAVFIVVPALVSVIMRAWTAPRAGVTVARLAAFGVPCGVVAALGIPFAFTDPDGFARSLQLLFTSTTQGHAHLGLDRGWATHFQYSLRFGVGAAMLAAGIIGAVVMAVRQPARAALLLSFPLAYFAVIGAAGNQYFRYVVPMVPFVCLTAASVVGLAAARLRRLPVTSAPRIAIGAAVAATLAIATEPAVRSWQFDRTLRATDSRVVAAAWVADHIPAGSSLLITGSHYGHPALPSDLAYRRWVWDRREQRYWSPEDDAERPEWILRQDHPLSTNPPIVDAWLRHEYVVAGRVTAMRSDPSSRTFDRMDAFYLPYAGFAGVERPGPNFTVYRRAAAPEPRTTVGISTAAATNVSLGLAAPSLR